MKLKRVFACFMSLLVLLSLAACGGNGGSSGNGSSSGNGGSSGGSGVSASDYSAENPMVLRFAGQSAEQTLIYYAHVNICEKVKEATNGALVIEYYPNNQLGDYTQVFDELIMGTIDMGCISPSDNINPLMNAAQVPALAATYEGMAEICGEGGFISDLCISEIEKLDLVCPGLFFNGMSGIGTVKEAADPANAAVDKGLIVRTPALITWQAGIEGLGFRTSALPYSDIFSSIQTGVIDGYGGGMPHTALKAFSDVVKYYYDYNLNAEFLPFLISKKTWDKLPAEWQEIITNACKEACAQSFIDVKEYEDECMAELTEKGIEVVTFTDEEREAYLDIMRSKAWPQLEEIYGAEFFSQLRESLA